MVVSERYLIALAEVEDILMLSTDLAFLKAEIPKIIHTCANVLDRSEAEVREDTLDEVADIIVAVLDEYITRQKYEKNLTKKREYGYAITAVKTVLKLFSSIYQPLAITKQQLQEMGLE